MKKLLFVILIKTYMFNKILKESGCLFLIC